MFGLFKRQQKKSHLAIQIESKGMDKVATDIVDGIMHQLSGTGYMFNFILAELDGASMGNEKAQRFARESGIPESQYKGAHLFEHPLIDGPNGAKTVMDTAALQMIDQRDLFVDFRLMVIDKLMRRVEVGKYDTEEDLESTKTGASKMIIELVQKQGASISKEDASTLIENVTSYIKDKDVRRAGYKVLAMSALSNVTAYSIDQGDLKMANVYANCFGVLMEKYNKEQMDSLTDYQKNALLTIMKEHAPIIKELIKANNDSIS